MKIELKKESAFQPITITVETEAEAALLELIFSYPATISETIEDQDSDLSKTKIERAMDDTKLPEVLARIGLGNDNWEKYFGK